MTGPTVPSEAVEAAARAIGGYSAEQWQRWQHTSKGQQAHDRAVAVLAAAVPVLQAQERERTESTEKKDVVRLSVNLAPDVAAVLRKWTRAKGLSTTEAIRRAIAVWNFVQEERAKGNKLAIIEKEGGGGERVREIVLNATAVPEGEQE